MKKMKTKLVYLIIAILCIASFAGYLIQKNSSTASEVAFINKTPEEKQKHVEELISKAAAKPDPNPTVGIGRGKNYSAVTKKAIENAGGLKDIIKKGSVVLIKPNLCMYGVPNSPTTTDYRIVSEVAAEAYKYGASKVIIAEGSIMDYNVFTKADAHDSKYDTIKNVQLYNFNGCKKKDCYKLKPKKSLTEVALLIPKIYMDADVVIDIAKLKTHSVTAATLSLKNAIGTTPSILYGTAGRAGLHDLGIDNAIIDLNRIRKPDFAIIDGIVGGEGDGPMMNTAVKSNIVLASKDLVALDTVSLNFMGFKIAEVTHVELAAKEKLGISNLKNIKIVGADLKSIKMDFFSPFKLD